MGKIRGDVDAIGIANLLQMLSMSHCEGILTVSQNLNRKSIRFSPAGMRILSSGGKNDHPLGEILVRGGKITRQQTEEVLVEQKRSGVHLGVTLVRKGLVSKEDVEIALKEQIAEDLYEMFTWTQATFEWTGGPAGESAPGASQDEPVLDADVTAVMLEASRLADELSRIQQIIPDPQMIPKRALEIPVSAEGEALRSILPLVDGRRTVGRLIEESGLAKFKVLSALYRLVQRGGIEIQSAKGETVLRRRSLPASVRAAVRDRRILLLSEGPQTSRPLAAMIRTGGLSVDEVPNSADLRDAVARLAPGAIVLDVPVDTDAGLAHCIRLRTVTETPFLVMASDTSPRALNHAHRSGARCILVRPVNEAILIERLAELLQAPS